MTEQNTETNKTPRCIGIIMDGNRRWARAEGLSPIRGHEKGYEKLLECVSWAKEAGVECVILYAFSTENWGRTAEEVAALLALMRTSMFERFDELKNKHARIRFIGDISRFQKDIRERIKKIEQETEHFSVPLLVIALSYGGRAEILSAIKKLPAASLQDITEEVFSRYLWTHDIPDPDLIIRTGGAKRLSNFLLWQSAYSEFYFTDTYWPAFSREEFIAALDQFAEAKRNFGT